MRFSKTQALALSVSALAMACGGPTVGEVVEQEVSLDVGGVYLGPSTIAGSDDRGDFSMSRALVSVGSMSLVPCADGAADVEIAARVYDLLAMPALGETVTTAVSEYCSLRVDFASVPKATDGIPADDWLLLEAQDANGPAAPLEGLDAPSLEFTPDDGASFGDQPLLLGFDVSVWLDYLAKDEQDPSPGTFDFTLGDVAALYVDADGNGALDDDEQTPIAQGKPPR